MSDFEIPPIPETRLKDSLGRRRRHAPRQPRKDVVRHVTPKQLQLIEWMHHCGGFLSTDVIREWNKITKVFGDSYLTVPLLNLHEELGMLDRPDFETGAKRIDPTIHPPIGHRVSEYAEDRLKARELYREHAPRPWGAVEHQMMVSNLYACYYIEALKRGIPFTHQHEILEKVGHGIDVMIGDDKLIPDAVFMLHFKEKPVLIFLEADKATEPGHSNDSKRKSWGRNIEQYKKLISDNGPIQKLYKSHYGVPTNCGAQVHVVTLPNKDYQPTMQKKIMAQIERVFGAKCGYIMLHTSYAFVPSCVPPKFISIFDTKWHSLGYETYTLPKE